MYINAIRVENFRCFIETDITLRNPDNSPDLKFSNINLLLGNNGSGKSSILKALALGILAPVLERSSGLVLYRMVRNTGAPKDIVDDAVVSVNLQLHDQDCEESRSSDSRTLDMTSTIRKKGSLEELRSETPEELIPDDVFDDNSPSFLVVGYGVTRRVEETSNYNFKEQTRIRRLRYSRVAGLFETNYGLIPLQSWLPQMSTENPGRYTQVVHLIDRLTPDDMGFEGEYIDDEYYFEFRGGKVPFGALSDGYRHFIGWIADLLYHICMGCPSGAKLVENRGVVLVDEIDLLLHPEWQRSVINSLSEHLPKLQFVFTTHSPIVASSVQSTNIFVMENDNEGAAKVVQYDENVYGRTSEQVLLSSYFGLATSRPESFINEEIAPESDKALQGDHEAALRLMTKLSKPIELDKKKFGDVLKNL